MKKESKREFSNLHLINLQKELRKVERAENYLEKERRKVMRDKEKIRIKIKKEREILRLKNQIKRVKSMKRIWKYNFL